MGFNLYNSEASAAHDGKLKRFSVDAAHATLLAPGDVIRLTGTADNGVAGVDAVAQGEALTGVIASVTPQFVGENLTETGLPASTAGTVLCHTDPDLDFEVAVSGTALTNDQVGLNADADVTAATKSGGLTVSNMALDSGTAAATATLQFRIVGLAPSLTTGEIDGTRAIVRINNSTVRAGTAGV